MVWVPTWPLLRGPAITGEPGMQSAIWHAGHRST